MMSLKISESSQENTYARVSFLIKLPVNFAKFLKTPFLIEHLGLLLNTTVEDGCSSDSLALVRE